MAANEKRTSKENPSPGLVDHIYPTKHHKITDWSPVVPIVDRGGVSSALFHHPFQRIDGLFVSSILNNNSNDHDMKMHRTLPMRSQSNHCFYDRMAIETTITTKQKLQTKKIHRLVAKDILQSSCLGAVRPIRKGTSRQKPDCDGAG